jgi:hypothetical protein
MEAQKILAEVERKGWDAAETMNIVKSAVNHAIVEKVVQIIVLKPTSECYYTAHSLTKAGKLRNSRVAWTFKAGHRELLEAVWKMYKGKSKTTFDEVLGLDMSLRMKKARGFDWCVVIAEEDGSSAIYDLKPMPVDRPEDLESKGPILSLRPDME